MARGTSPKKDKIILLLKLGETDRNIIANKVGCSTGYVSIVIRESHRSRKVTCG